MYLCAPQHSVVTSFQHFSNINPGAGVQIFRTYSEAVSTKATDYPCCDIFLPAPTSCQAIATSSRVCQDLQILTSNRTNPSQNHDCFVTQTSATCVAAHLLIACSKLHVLVLPTGFQLCLCACFSPDSAERAPATTPGRRHACPANH